MHFRPKKEPAREWQLRLWAGRVRSLANMIGKAASCVAYSGQLIRQSRVDGLGSCNADYCAYMWLVTHLSPGDLIQLLR